MRKLIDLLLISISVVLLLMSIAKAKAEDGEVAPVDNSEIQKLLVVGEDFDQVLGLKTSAADFMQDLIKSSIFESSTQNYFIFQKDFFANNNQDNFDNYLHATIYGDELYDDNGNIINDKTFLGDILNFKYRDEIKYYYPLLMNQELFVIHEINLREFLSGIASALFHDKPLFALLVARYLNKYSLNDELTSLTIPEFNLEDTLRSLVEYGTYVGKLNLDGLKKELIEDGYSKPLRNCPKEQLQVLVNNFNELCDRYARFVLSYGKLNHHEVIRKLSPILGEDGFDKVLSLSYNSNFIPLLKDSTDVLAYEYFLGNATLNNIVLGYNNDLGVMAGTYYRGIEFNKSYQRRERKTTNNFINWLNEPYELTFLGFDFSLNDIELVDKLFNYQTENLSKVTIYYSKDESPDKLKQKLMQNIGIENYEKLFIKGKKSLEFVKYQVQD